VQLHGQNWENRTGQSGLRVLVFKKPMTRPAPQKEKEKLKNSTPA